MNYIRIYSNYYQKVINDSSICEDNRKIFIKHLDKISKDLKRLNQLPSLDIKCHRTLLNHLSRMVAVNKWFKNKSWKELTKKDIQNVFDAVEAGTITRRDGLPYTNTTDYYKRVFFDNPFKLANKHKIAQQVIGNNFPRKKKDIRFTDEESFKQIIDAVIQFEHKCFLWLCFDIGENPGALIQLTKSDCIRHINPINGEIEYRIDLKEGVIKRTRTARIEVTMYKETAQYLDRILSKKNDDENIFSFGYMQAMKFFKRALRVSEVKSVYHNKELRLKDLRKSMACNLFVKGWSVDDIKSRLGHTPSSTAIDAYLTFSAKLSNVTKNSFLKQEQEKLRENLHASQDREQLLMQEIRRLQELKSPTQNGNPHLF